MSNEINNLNNKPSVQANKNDKNEKMSLKEAAKIVYEESIFGKAEKAHKALNKDIPEKILEKSQSWGWVQKLQKFFGVETQQNTQETEQKNK